MHKILNVLKDGASGAFATVNNGKPDVRPWQFQFEEGGKLYFCTANNKDVFKQLKANPVASFTTTTPEFVTVRVTGEVEFVNDLTVKEKILETQPMIKNLYQTADNPIFETFYIEHGEAVIADFSGQPPEKINF